MAIVISTNVNSLLAQNYLVNNQEGLSRALQRLSSGQRINEASDDPAGLAITTTLNMTIGELGQGARNGNDGISLIQTAQAAISNISNTISTMSTLAEQAANGVYSSTQLSNLNTEFAALLSSVNRIASNTQFNGVSLLDGTTSSITIQVGSGNTSNDRLTISLSNMTTGSAGLNIASLDVSTLANAQTALQTLNALTAVTTALSDLGANQININGAVQNNNSLIASLGAAKSRIADADYAAESANLAKYQILNQANIAMLAQANSTPQLALKLLG